MIGRVDRTILSIVTVHVFRCLVCKSDILGGRLCPSGTYGLFIRSDSYIGSLWELVVPQRSEHNDGRADRLRWMREARFGLFVHWGLYSVAARHEWVKQRERLDDAAYQRYFEHFDPDLYDPRRWARSWPGRRACAMRS